MEENNATSGIISVVLAVISFFVGMFVLQIVAILVGLLPEKKTELNYIGVAIAVISLVADLVVLNSYY